MHIGNQYGISEGSLAYRIGQTHAHARGLIAGTQADRMPAVLAVGRRGAGLRLSAAASLYGVWLDPACGGYQVNPRTLSNYPMQANGAEMLRIAL